MVPFKTLLSAMSLLKENPQVRGSASGRREGQEAEGGERGAESGSHGAPSFSPPADALRCPLPEGPLCTCAGRAARSLLRWLWGWSCEVGVRRPAWARSQHSWELWPGAARGPPGTDPRRTVSLPSHVLAWTWAGVRGSQGGTTAPRACGGLLSGAEALGPRPTVQLLMWIKVEDPPAGFSLTVLTANCR